MAPINSKFLCLMALLLISTTCLSSQVSETETNIGMKANLCAGREPYQYSCTPEGCVIACKKLGCGTGVCHTELQMVVAIALDEAAQSSVVALICSKKTTQNKLRK